MPFIEYYFAINIYLLYNLDRFNLFHNIYIFYIKSEENEVDFAEHEAVEIKIQDYLPHYCHRSVNSRLSGVFIHKHPERHHPQNEPAKSRACRIYD